MYQYGRTEVDVARQGKEGENGDIDDTEDGQAFWERCVRFSSHRLDEIYRHECLDDVLFPHKSNSSTKGKAGQYKLRALKSMNRNQLARCGTR